MWSPAKTRARTGILLKHFDIHKPQVTFHEHNEDRAGGRIMALLEEGKSVAVVTRGRHAGHLRSGLLDRAPRDRAPGSR